MAAGPWDADSGIAAVTAGSSTGSTGSSTATKSPRLLIHVTPLRCSRALALRHLATSLRKPLGGAWTLVAFAPQTGGTPTAAVSQPTVTAVSSTGKRLASAGSVGHSAGNSSVTVVLRSTEGEELLGGVQRVVLLPAPAVQPTAEPAFPMDVGVFRPAVVHLPPVAGAGEGASAEGQGQGLEGGAASRVVVVAAP